ncbi:hypothetical protein, partial [Alteromonas sp. AMM-1]|uniref:hypothetical protein n=1 Tax=Alteromonas sp. AMM-1 TaxID=3394233 RepID=UPI0039A56B40
MLFVIIKPPRTFCAITLQTMWRFKTKNLLTVLLSATVMLFVVGCTHTEELAQRTPVLVPDNDM